MAERRLLSSVCENRADQDYSIRLLSSFNSVFDSPTDNKPWFAIDFHSSPDLSNSVINQLLPHVFQLLHGAWFSPVPQGNSANFLSAASASARVE